MTKRIILAAVSIIMAVTLSAREFHVSKQGPLCTINEAAQLALPGDTVTVHGGVYREWVDPLRGGSDVRHPILYRAAEGEEVEIKGSEEIKGWKKAKSSGGKLWTVTIPNSMFGTFNPFSEVFVGDWLNTPFQMHMADVFINDRSLYESVSADSLLVARYSHRDPDGCLLNWYAQVEAENTIVTACFGDMDPNKERVEISVRPTCFYPTREGLNYITVRGFKISQAATRWAAPTAEQVGMVAPHWSKGWIIEDNEIRNAKSSGITLGKEAGTGDNVWTYDTRLKDGHLHYIECVFRALRHGWNEESVGSHIIRNNVISDCGQAGICGSLGCSFSEVYGNIISNACMKDEFTGAEQGGIKFHAAVDVYIHDNTIHDCIRGIWMDWMAQGARVSSNVMYGNVDMDLFFEMDHGPYVVDNNLLLSRRSLLDCSSGGAYLHNLFGGVIDNSADYRYIPYMLEHSTTIKGVSSMMKSDNRFIENIFIVKQADANPLAGYDNNDVQPMKEGNINESEVQKGIERFYSTFGTFDGTKLGVTYTTGLPYENPDGTSSFAPGTRWLDNERCKLKQ